MFYHVPGGKVKLKPEHVAGVVAIIGVYIKRAERGFHREARAVQTESYGELNEQGRYWKTLMGGLVGLIKNLDDGFRIVEIENALMCLEPSIRAIESGKSAMLIPVNVRGSNELTIITGSASGVDSEGVSVVPEKQKRKRVSGSYLNRGVEKDAGKVDEPDGE